MQTAHMVSKFRLYGDEAEDLSPDLVHIETIDSRAGLHNWRIEAHTHPGLEQLVFVSSGTARFEANGDILTLGQRHAVYIPSDCPHGFSFGHDVRGWVLTLSHSVLADPRLSQLVGLRATESRQRRLRVITGGDDTTRLIETLLGDITSRADYGQVAVTPTLCAILALILALIEEGETAEPTAAGSGASTRHDLFLDFLRLVEHDFRGGCDVATYSDKLSCSQATLSRATREGAGLSPAKIIAQRRILEAKRALIYTSASVSQVAEDVGFADQAYFARSFRQATGMTPSRYRRNNTSRL